VSSSLRPGCDWNCCCCCCWFCDCSSYGLSRLVKLFLICFKPLSPLAMLELKLLISSRTDILCLTPPQLIGRLLFFSLPVGFIICYFSFDPFRTLLSLSCCVKTGGWNGPLALALWSTNLLIGLIEDIMKLRLSLVDAAMPTDSTMFLPDFSSSQLSLWFSTLFCRLE